MKKLLFVILYVIISITLFGIIANKFGSKDINNDLTKIRVEGNFSSAIVDNTSAAAGNTRSIDKNDFVESRSIFDWFFKPKPKPTEKKKEKIDSTPTSLEVISLHNLERMNRQLAPLVIDKELQVAAEGQAKDLASRDKPGSNLHIGNNGSTPWQRINNTGYRYSNASENAAAGWVDNKPYFLGTEFSPALAMQGWIASGGHKQNILGPYKEIGVGIGQAKSGRLYYIVVFGTRNIK